MSEQEEPAEQSEQDAQTDQDDQAEPTEHSESEKPPPFDADRRGCRTNFCDVRYADCGDCLCSGLSSFLVLAMSVGLLRATAGIGAMGRRLRHEPQAPDAALAAALHR